MKTRTFQLAALAAALTLTAACGSRRPPQLPPGPPTGSETGTGADSGTTDPNGTGTTAVPGSRADFLQNVPSDRVFFDTDSYTLTDEGRSVLDAQAAWLLRFPDTGITIEGHADERGTREYNLALGDRRANSVRNYLESRGVPAHRMTTLSWGKERPEVEGSNETAWAQNRRAVTVLPD
ncbi:peptidoglycan-associated lipoprotein Pal [Allosphingosinicella sp.]|jgi:peptidoglycan-associated lipoprotein|uniref:peptidoglycan-associated lipoprotein Pal n=1 Tax=Allosphingosinicella sp. TaxID=2823234 RepID=UPI002F00DEC8